MRKKQKKIRYLLKNSRLKSNNHRSNKSKKKANKVYKAKKIKKYKVKAHNNLNH